MDNTAAVIGAFVTVILAFLGIAKLMLKLACEVLTKPNNVTDI